MVDPVAGALTAFGLPVAHADLIAGLAFAAVLEGVACFAWLLALRPDAAIEIAVTPVGQGSHAESVTAVTPASIAATPVTEPVTAPALEPVPALESPAVDQVDDVTRARRAVTAGTLRPTVIEIRKYLGCSQARAAAVRKQLARQIIE
jgi:hypothetical protein